MGLSDCSSAESYVISNLSKEKDTNLNLKATELRLGLPGSQSPDRDCEISVSSSELAEKPFFPLLPVKDGFFSTLPKTVVFSNKRVFSDAMDGFSKLKSSAYGDGNWTFPTTGSEKETAKVQGKISANLEVNAILSTRSLPNSVAKPISIKEQPVASSTLLKEMMSSKVLQDGPHTLNNTNHDQMPTNNDGNAPAAKWRPGVVNREEEGGERGRTCQFSEILGKGATKTVYRAFDELQGMEVAWNQAKLNDVFRSPEELERLYSEVHLLSTVNHDSIIHSHASWIDVEKRTINFITEMYTSGTLREYFLISSLLFILRN
ncbi:hypothetical protein MRB53_014112 [Persea americana]|uniref:Uncharacterized protein n=1 Tax=Persea americana TaxID=3435 RepID=A0ACC2KA18_PERAE|nr:hypothetical protein MRB53_014112 [Persea americana]